MVNILNKYYMNQTFDRFADGTHIISFLSYRINYEKLLPHAVDCCCATQGPKRQLLIIY